MILMKKLLNREVRAMSSELGILKAKRFVKKLENGKIKVDRRPNHGKDFYGALEKQHKEVFHDYLGSCTRFLMNRCLEEQKYYG